MNQSPYNHIAHTKRLNSINNYKKNKKVGLINQAPTIQQYNSEEGGFGESEPLQSYSPWKKSMEDISSESGKYEIFLI